jgi:integrase
MSIAEPVEFNPKLWDTEELQLTSQQVECIPVLQKVLSDSKIAISKVIAECQSRGWKPNEMRALEGELLAKIGKGIVLKRSFDILAKLSYRHRQLQKLRPNESPLPRLMLGVKVEKNPFRVQDFVAQEELIIELRNWVGQTAKKLTNDQHLTEKALPLAMLSCITNLHVLHESVVVALLEALADRGTSWIGAGRDAGGWLLSLAWGGVDDEERRLLLPDALSGVLLAKATGNLAHTVFGSFLDRTVPLKKRHALVLSTLDRSIQSLFVEFEAPKQAALREILDAAQTVSYLHLPAAVAALRCRKTVSHSPRKEVLARLFSGSQVGDQSRQRGPNITVAEMEECVDPEIVDTAEVTPDWIKMMRRAFRRKKMLQSQTEVLRQLELAAMTDDAAGRAIVEFAIHILGGRSSKTKLAVSSAERYSLLIARRLGQRLDGEDPSQMPEEIEDHFRGVLEDDWEELSSEDENLPAPKNKRPTVEALRLFQKFLEDERGAPKLSEELAAALKRRGLLPVDANFITVDEYQRVLKAIHRTGHPDRSVRAMLWLNVVLGFRCGMRRKEAFYLRVEDFDKAEHFYVRSHKLRKVKTSNSTRAIPYGILMSNDEPFNEIEELKKLIGNRSTGLLFADDKGKLLMSEEDAFVEIHSIMRNELGDRTLRFHHLRHSFATLLAAKLQPGTRSFCEQYLSRHPATLEWLSDREVFRAKLFGCDDRMMLDVQAIAHLLGHGGCSVSVENYIHSLDWLAG